jgi:hypothetical protein
MKARSLLCLLVVMLLTSLASSVFAQTVIKQTKTTIFPITISKSGSYVLESNITAPGTYTGDIVEVSASYVTLDLNGFDIGGGSSQNGSSTAIRGGSNVIIRNGIINAGTTNGINVGELSRVERIRVDIFYNFVGDASQVLDSNFYYLFGGNNSLFSGNVAYGMQGSSGTLATHNVTFGGGISGVTSLGDNLCNGVKC